MLYLVSIFNGPRIKKYVTYKKVAELVIKIVMDTVL